MQTISNSTTMSLINKIRLKYPDNDIDSETLNPDFKGKHVYYYIDRPFLCSH